MKTASTILAVALVVLAAEAEPKQPDTLGHRLLKLEAEVEPVPDQAYRLLDRILAEARERLGPAIETSPHHGADDRHRAVAAVREIGRLLHELGFRYRGEVHSLAEALAPAGSASRIRRFDCDTGSFIYLSIAEELSLPLALVEIPDHNFVRWQLADGGHVDWDVNRTKVRRPRDFGPLYGRSMTADEVAGYFYFLRGVSWQDRGDDARAIRDYQRSIALHPRSWQARNNLSWIYLSAGRDEPARRQALRLAEEQVTLTETATTLSTLACALAADGRFDDAVTTQRRALELEASRKLRKRLKLLRAEKTCI